MKQRSVKFVTLGCKVNQYESQAMAEQMSSRDLRDVSGSAEPCDFVVINTCTVTAEADKNNRYWIRRMKRENPFARLVVTGCYVEKNRAELDAMPEVDLILSNYEKDKLAEAVFSSLCARGIETGSDPVPEPMQIKGSDAALSKMRFAPLSVSHAQSGATRAFVKIQDGCNHACSFCKVVLVRGRSRSRDLNSIVAEIRRLAETGHQEIVFAGIQLGAYGLDFEDSEYLRKPALREHYFLTDVIEAAAEVSGIERIRLSSIEPIDIGQPLVDCMVRVKKFCPQLHIPLQSGDSEILARMNRRYTREFYRDLVLKLRDRIPDFELTLDVMAGFPGEEELHFENTLKLLEEVEPLKCHIFPYSRREGTRAAGYPDVAPDRTRERVRRLSALADRLTQKRLEKYIGREMYVLVERPKEKNGIFEGLTANYLRAFFSHSENVRGQLVPVKFLAAQESVLLSKALVLEAVHA